METWMWISLWILQTIVGAVLWRRFFKDNVNNNGITCFILSGVVFSNIFFLLAWIGSLISELVDYLAGVKNKTEEK